MQLLSPDLPTEEALHSFVSEVADRYDVDVCTVYRYDANDHVLTLVATKGLRAQAVGYKFSASRGLTGRVINTGKPFSVKHPANHPDYHYVEGSGEEDLQSYLGMPLMNFGEILGVMVVQTKSARAFLFSEIEAFYDAGKQVVSAFRLPDAMQVGSK